VEVEEIVSSPMDGAVDELQPRAHVRLMQPIFQSYDRVEIVGIWHKPHASEDMTARSKKACDGHKRRRQNLEVLRHHAT